MAQLYGKTMPGKHYRHTTHAEFVEVFAITWYVKDRREIEAAESRLLTAVEELFCSLMRFIALHAQQDALLHAVEDRIVVPLAPHRKPLL